VFLWVNMFGFILFEKSRQKPASSSSSSLSMKRNAKEEVSRKNKKNKQEPKEEPIDAAKTLQELENEW
jgi:hypothetical protein